MHVEAAEFDLLVSHKSIIILKINFIIAKHVAEEFDQISKFVGSRSFNIVRVKLKILHHYFTLFNIFGLIITLFNDGNNPTV